MTNTSCKGKLFVISGPSGAGKGTICDRIIKETKGIELSVSMTTRAPREGEVEGKSYFFTTHEEFKKEIEAGGFFEHAEVYGNFYGTPKKKVYEKLEQGTDVLLEIDIQGALNAKKAYPEAILIFVLPPSMSILKSRLIGRGTDSQEAIEMRLSKTKAELTFIDQYDYCIINDELEDAVNAAKAILLAERSKVTADIHKLIERYEEEI